MKQVKAIATIQVKTKVAALIVLLTIATMLRLQVVVILMWLRLVQRYRPKVCYLDLQMIAHKFKIMISASRFQE